MSRQRLPAASVSTHIVRKHCCVGMHLSTNSTLCVCDANRPQYVCRERREGGYCANTRVVFDEKETRLGEEGFGW